MNAYVLTAYAVILLAISLVDVRKHLILNALTYPAMVGAFFIGWLVLHKDPVDIMAGGYFGVVLMAFLVISTKGGVGWGDAKLAGLIGMMIGSPLPLIYVLPLALLIGGMIAAFYIYVKKQKTGDIPYAPALSLAAMVALVWRPMW